MILVFDDKHKEDLSFVAKIGIKEVQQFCQISLNFIKEGANKKLFVGAAQQLKVHPTVIQHAVEGLGHLFTKASQHRISENDFVTSLKVVAFSEELIEILKQFYMAHSDEVRRILSSLSFSLPKYKNMEWRFDMQIASRSLHNNVEPVFTLRFDTMQPSKIHKTYLLQADVANLKHLCTSLEKALKESSSAETNRIMRNVK
eukprot:TRINITY_DN8421_c0_g1_i1.p1 TRINITY_DN8421_c0_g1~~TRINITY_DN8421_c0_g1_i1.p1  ORF type:complete len:201 (+),score=36.86 TRINITY_DN8421_c0_g1_i1:8-610(+)